MIDESNKLILAHMQVENCIRLLKDNMYENYMVSKLYGVKYELERQMKGGKKITTY